jgi:hypothetical protein
MNIYRVLTLFVLATVLAGCAASSYKYNNVSYHSETEALSAQQERFKVLIAEIHPVGNKVGGTLRMYFPDQDVGRQILVTGNKTSVYADYVLKARYADTKFIRDVIEKRAIFDKVDLRYSKGDHKSSEADADVLYYFGSTDGTYGWYFVGKRIPRTPVQFDSGAKGADRLEFFLETLEGLARADK